MNEQSPYDIPNEELPGMWDRSDFMGGKADADRSQEIIREMANLAYLIHVQWWRPLKNRQRRQQLMELLREGEGL